MTLMLIAPLCCNALAGAIPPATFPMLDPAATRPVVVLANLSVAGGVKLPKLKDCLTPDQRFKASDTIARHPCTDAEPYAFRASAVKPVYGSALPATFYIATTGAQGLRNFNHGNVATAMLVLTDNKHAVMPRNARARVWSDSAGGQWIVVDGKRPPAFLPCSVASLMQDLPQDKIVANQYGELGQPFPESRGDPGEQVTVAGRLRPRFGIPVSRLQVHLATLKPGLADIWCEPAGVDAQAVTGSSR